MTRNLRNIAALLILLWGGLVLGARGVGAFIESDQIAYINGATSIEELRLLDLRSHIDLNLLPHYDTCIAVCKPVWSQDGHRLAFAGDLYKAQTSTRVFVLDFPELAVRQISEGDITAFAPTWLPNQAEVAYITRTDSDNPYLIANVDTYERRVPNFALTGFFQDIPRWSPDGQWIAFDGLTVYSTERKQIEWGLYGSLIRHVDWHGDSQAMLFSQISPGQSGYDIAMINISTQEVTELIIHPMNDLEPDWAPDGERFVFVSDRRGSVDFFVRTADGSLEQVTFGRHAFSPAWRP